MRKTPLKRKSWLKRVGPLKRRSPAEDGKPAPYHRLIRKKPFSQLKQRNPMKQRSSKRAKEEARYRIVNAEYVKEHPICEVCLKEGRRRKTQSVHHKGRRHGRWLCDKRFFLATCNEDHDRIEKNGNWAREQGYLLTIAQRRAVDAQK